MSEKDPRTRGRQAGTSRHSRTDEEKLCLLREVGGLGRGDSPGIAGCEAPATGRHLNPNLSLNLNLRRRSRHWMPGLVCCVCCVLLTACIELLLLLLLPLPLLILLLLCIPHSRSDAARLGLS